MRTDPQEFRQLELRAHALLADVPLHDVWATELPGGPDLTMLDLRELLSPEGVATASPAVGFLFRLRKGLGRLLGWDHEPGPGSGSFVERLSAAERESSLVEPGTRDGPFRVLFVSPREAISEIRNATVHAFSVFALRERPTGHRFYWAVYVRPVGRVTSWYMKLIDPFRRAIVYPAVLRHLEAAWARRVAREGGRGMAAAGAGTAGSGAGRA